jgi:hypothetical protein
LAPKAEDPADSNLADLFHQLVDDGRTFVRAEINLYRQIALHRASKARNGLIALAVGGVLLFAALLVLLIMIALWLTAYMGPIAAGLIVAVVVGLGGFLLIRAGAANLGALGGDEEEKAALGEKAVKP